MNLRYHLLFFTLVIFSQQALAQTTQSGTGHDICQTKFTKLHYVESACFDIPRTVSEKDPSRFSVRAVLLTKKLAEVDSKETLIIIPGGPGASAEPLKTELEKRDILNALWHHMNMNVILFDPRATGRSTLPKITTDYDNSAISVEKMVDDLKAVVEAVRPGKKVSLLAHSAGGFTALAFAVKYPELTDKIVLLSASDSPRTFARLNQALLAKEFWIWDEFTRSLKPSVKLDRAKAQYLRVADTLEQQLKARILGKFENSLLKGLSPKVFREELLQRLEKDPSGELAFAWLEEFTKKLDELESFDGTLTPPELRTLKLTDANLTPLTYGSKEWIQRLIMCGEGTLETELDLPLFYDGITMRRFCGDLSATQGARSGKVTEVELEKVQAPVLILSGKDDTQVPPMVAREMAKRIRKSELIVTEGTGHNFVDKAPVAFYYAVEKFFAPENKSNHADK